MTEQPLIKICGVRTVPILECVIGAGADMVGFMRVERSPRHVDLDTLAELISIARGRIETVVVLVNPDNTTIAEIAALDPDWIQLHGPETVHRVEMVRANAGIPVMKAVGVASAGDLAQVPAFNEVADRILIDAKSEAGADRQGGNGQRFDWGLLKALDPAIPFMLSGGLDPDNVAEAVKSVCPFGLDLSSGVETAPGVKSEELIRLFIANARAAAG